MCFAWKGLEERKKTEEYSERFHSRTLGLQCLQQGSWRFVFLFFRTDNLLSGSLASHLQKYVVEESLVSEMSLPSFYSFYLSPFRLLFLSRK